MTSTQSKYAKTQYEDSLSTYVVHTDKENIENCLLSISEYYDCNDSTQHTFLIEQIKDDTQNLVVSIINEEVEILFDREALMFNTQEFIDSFDISAIEHENAKLRLRRLKDHNYV